MLNNWERGTGGLRQETDTFVEAYEEGYVSKWAAVPLVM